MNKRECPYCDHPNLPSAKFCIACGAAMHLAPCPHCGAVNDISATECYRCHGELTPPEVPQEVAGEDALPSDQPAGSEPSAESATAEDPPNARPSLLVIGIILIAFAAASYYAFRQRSTNDARAKPAPVAAPAPQVSEPISKPAPAPVVETVIPATAAPATPVEPAAPPPVVKAAPAIAKPATPVVREPASPNRVVPPKTSKPAAPAPTLAPSPASTPATPVTTPAATPPVCTEAVAALGLCKPDSKAPETK